MEIIRRPEITPGLTFMHDGDMWEVVKLHCSDFHHTERQWEVQVKDDPIRYRYYRQEVIERALEHEALLCRDGKLTTVAIIPEHWHLQESGFEYADVYSVVDTDHADNLATVCLAENKNDWQINSGLGEEVEKEIIAFIRSHSRLTTDA